ncbi:EamA family transporter [Rhodobacter sp. CCP-1]|uniref:EamA family transporter n=2 Tax=Paragemmobacter ruber TaxID=1985673 RepID=A0ABW9Y9N2_9RHOB|nr:EamA family transporter [Rhodobacter ruber]
MVAAMAGFAVEDMFLKSVTAHIPLGQALLIFGLTGAAFFAIRAKRAGDTLLHPALLSRPLLLRSGFEVAGRLFYSLAIALTPLSTASAILQATPLVVVAGAALLFGERVGWRRWTAITLGFAGVLLILRPGAQGFTLLSLVTVAGMLGFAGRDLATRAAPPALSNRQLGVIGMAMLAIAGAVILSVTGGARLPDPTALAMLAGVIVFGIAGYNALTIAMRTGEVSVVTPFRYTRLVFAMILGIVVFQERPDALTLAGSALVVASGLYTLSRARRA